MKRKVPKIMDHMTILPHTVGKNISIQKAEEMMKELQIRHLPVLDSGKLVGLISDRDIKESYAYRGKGELDVGEVMSTDPYFVNADALLDDVLEVMCRHKYGSAIVTSQEGRVIGIFTEIDAYRLLIQTLHGNSRAAFPQKDHL